MRSNGQAFKSAISIYCESGNQKAKNHNHPPVTKHRKSEISIQQSAFHLNQEPRNPGVALRISIQHSTFSIQRGAAAFTLIELVVVILIISTLAALLFTGASKVFDNAKKTQAKNDLSQLVNAVNAYYTEYGKYPMVDANQGTDTTYGRSGTNPGNQDVCNVLRAIATGVNANNALNPRQIVFLTGRDSSRARSGFTTTATTDSQGKSVAIGAFIDPYNNAYIIAMDGNYDGATADPSTYSDLAYATGSTVRTGCFGESFGKDGKQGRNGDKKYSGSDDVLTWQ